MSVVVSHGELLKRKNPALRPGFGVKTGYPGELRISNGQTSCTIPALVLPWSGALALARDNVIADEFDQAVERKTGDNQPSDKAEHVISFQLFLANEWAAFPELYPQPRSV